MALLSSSFSYFFAVAIIFGLISTCRAWSDATKRRHHHHHPWESFRNFSGCFPGDHCAGLKHVKQYLYHFGHLPAFPGNFSDDFDHQLESALVAYQHFFHLNASGTLDTSTLSLITKPRCGTADVHFNGNASPKARGRYLYSYVDGRPSWPPSKRHLTYAFTSPADVPPATRALVARAFDPWAAVRPVTAFSFSETHSGNADITIGFYSGIHNDSSAFDGRGGVLAHAFRPTDGRPAVLHVDADEQWVVEGDVTTSPGSFDMESVMVHEIGHILGLGHSTVKSAVMFPSIAAGTRKVMLANDDIQGIQGLYGAKGLCLYGSQWRIQVTVGGATISKFHLRGVKFN